MKRSTSSGEQLGAGSSHARSQPLPAISAAIRQKPLSETMNPKAQSTIMMLAIITHVGELGGGRT
jgi:hypothetical protein